MKIKQRLFSGVIANFSLAGLACSKLIKLSCCLTLLLLVPNAWADTFVCPTTYQTVMTGYTMDQVLVACGQPTTQQTYDTQINKPIERVQWVYMLPNSSPQNMNQYAPQLIITFNNDQVEKVVSTNQTSATLFSCYRSNRIAIGNTTNQVRAQCGSPNMVNTIQQGDTQKVSSTQWTYNFGAYRPQMIFIFQDGKLNQIKMGQLSK